MKNYKRILSTTLGGIVLFTTISLGKTGIINAPNGLVLREKASKSANPITTIGDKANVEIVDESGEWYKVKYNNQEGYLFAEYVNIEKQEEVKVEEEKTKEPAVEQVEEVKNDSDEIKDNTANEQKQYPQKQKIKSNAKIYSIPSVTAKTVSNGKKGEELTINYELNNWLNVTYGKNTGWIRKYFVNNQDVLDKTNTDNEKKDDAKPEETKQEQTEIKTIDNKKGYVDVSNSANIREKASTDSNIINTLLKNTEVTIIAEEGDFYKIEYKDITGYIAKSLISEKPVN